MDEWDCVEDDDDQADSAEPATKPAAATRTARLTVTERRRLERHRKMERRRQRAAQPSWQVPIIPGMVPLHRKAPHGPLHLPRVCVDLSLCARLPEREQRSVVSQVAQLVGINHRSGRTLDLHLVGVGCAGPQELLRAQHGFDSTWHVTRHASGHLLDAFQRESVVYLSPDSPHVLEDLDEARVYVLGGIADNHNSCKNMTLERATELGVAHARLPLEVVPNITKRGQILNINHCFQVLLLRAAGIAWYEAIDRSVPTRDTFRRADE